MKEVIFYGASDDLFEIEGAFREEFPCYDGTHVKLLDQHGLGVMVFAYYALKNIAPTWMIGLSPIDENAPMPDWPVSYKIHENGYSAELTIQVPDDVMIVGPDED